MQEFTTVSSSTYEPAALAARLTEKSAEGWQVVSIVPTGGDITAFLVRSTSAEVAPDASGVAAGVAAGGAAGVATGVAASVAASDALPATGEPAGWAVAPVSASTTPASNVITPDTTSPAPSTVSAVQTTAAPTPSVPAGWYSDPSGRYELRYWDGTEWTEHVSRAGQQYTDPPVR